MFTGPWRWSSGERAHVLLQRSNFEATIFMFNCLWKEQKQTEKEAGIGPIFKQNIYSVVYINWVRFSWSKTWILSSKFLSIWIISTYKRRVTRLMPGHIQIAFFNFYLSGKSISVNIAQNYFLKFHNTK